MNIQFRPDLHPRNRLGRFIEVLGSLKPGDSVGLPNGVKVQSRGRGTFRVSATARTRGGSSAMAAIQARPDRSVDTQSAKGAANIAFATLSPQSPQSPGAPTLFGELSPEAKAAQVDRVRDSLLMTKDLPGKGLDDKKTRRVLPPMSPGTGTPADAVAQLDAMVRGSRVSVGGKNWELRRYGSHWGAPMEWMHSVTDATGETLPNGFPIVEHLSSKDLISKYGSSVTALPRFDSPMSPGTGENAPLTDRQWRQDGITYTVVGARVGDSGNTIYKVSNSQDDSTFEMKIEDMGSLDIKPLVDDMRQAPPMSPGTSGAMDTPWGKTDGGLMGNGVTELSPDVIYAMTPGHGGIGVKIGSDSHKRLSPESIKFSEDWSHGLSRMGGYQWFEEDGAPAVLAKDLPELFPSPQSPGTGNEWAKNQQGRLDIFRSGGGLRYKDKLAILDAAPVGSDFTITDASTQRLQAEFRKEADGTWTQAPNSAISEPRKGLVSDDLPAPNSNGSYEENLTHPSPQSPGTSAMRDQMATTDAAQQTDNAMTFDNPAQAFGQASKARAEALARNDTGLADEWQATMVAAQKAVDAEQVEMGLPKPPPMGIGMSEGDLNSMELGSTILVKGDVWEQIGVGRWQGKANGTELSSGQLAKGIPFNPDFYPKSPQSPGTGKTMTTAQAERELADLRKKNFFGSVLLGKRISQLEDMLHQSKEGGPDPMSAEDALHQEMEGGPQSPGTGGIKDKPISGLADEIRADWKNVNFAAAPYLDAMNSLDSIDDQYFQDNGRSIVSYFLSNATGWRGEKAKEIKAELQRRLGR